MVKCQHHVEVWGQCGLVPRLLSQALRLGGPLGSVVGQPHRSTSCPRVDPDLGSCHCYTACKPDSGRLTCILECAVQDVQAQQSLAVQLQALADWEHYMFGRLKVFKVSMAAVATQEHMSSDCLELVQFQLASLHGSTMRSRAEQNHACVTCAFPQCMSRRHATLCDLQSRFRTATFSLVGGADAEQFSVGAENVHYEGPLQIQLQVSSLPHHDAVQRSHVHINAQHMFTVKFVSHVPLMACHMPESS